MASIGVGGKGQSDTDDAGKAGDMVAICDVDESTLNDAGEKRFPKAKQYTDFRKMLDEMGKSIDAVTVSTPDHTHAPAALMAMRMGKHCFCQKPLTHTIYEARLMAQVAAREESRHADGQPGDGRDALRKAAAIVQVGRAGPGQGGPRLDQPADLAARRRAAQAGAVPGAPELGPVARPAPARPYANGYHPVHVARLVGFRHRRLGRHGLPHREHALHGPESPRSDRRSGRDLRPQQGQLSRSGRSSPSSSPPWAAGRP